MNIINENLSKVSLSLLLILVLGLAFVYSDDTRAATFNVPGDFATIQEAIDDPGTMNGDTINILAGTHVEAFVDITKELIIQGQGIGVTILDPSSIGGFTAVLYPKADNIIIRDLTIENADQAIRFEIAGGTIDNTDLIRVEMRNNASRGIEFHNDTTITNLLIDECNFENTVFGLRIASSAHLDGARIEDSTFTSNGMALYMTAGSSTMNDILIRRNTFTDHTLAHGSQGTALYFEDGTNVTIRNNDFVDNRRDVQIFKWFNPSRPVANILISNNRMTGTTNAVFAIFNADNGGPTEFDRVRFLRNDIDTEGAGGSYVFAGAYRTSVGAGIGWNTVRIRNNCFTGIDPITDPGNGIRYFVPAGVDPLDPLGGQTLDVIRNWWGTASALLISALMQVPNMAVNDYMPFRTTSLCPTISTTPVVPGMAGVMNDFGVTEATPGGDVAIVWGDMQQRNVEAHDICRKLILGIVDAEILGMTSADKNGDATVSVPISEKMTGQTMSYQAVDLSSCTSGEVLEETF